MLTFNCWCVIVMFGFDLAFWFVDLDALIVFIDLYCWVVDVCFVCLHIGLLLL